MEHPWMDLERNLVCSIVLLVWSSGLLALSTMPFLFKLLCFGTVVGLIVYHAQRKHLTYEIVMTYLLVSGLLASATPAVLLQTVFLVYGVLLLASLCLFLPVDMIFLVIVLLLAGVYSLLLTLAIAVHSDSAFTALFLLALTSGWLGFLRPVARNAV